MKNRKLIFMLAIYMLFIITIFLSARTLTKYFTSSDVNGNFDIGKKLYFHYDRGDLFRNNQLIVGVEVEQPKYDEDGNVVSVSRRIETMNVIPGDKLIYHFFISNVNLATNEANGIDGVFHTFGTSQLSIPVKGSTYDLNCEIKYRSVDQNGQQLSPFKTFTSDLDENLPIYNKDDENTYARYEFQITVTLDDQVESTDKDDYFGATLSIYLSAVAANKISWLVGDSLWLKRRDFLLR